MKLLTNKQFQGEIEKQLRPLRQEIEDLNIIIGNQKFEYLSAKEDYEKERDALIRANEGHQDIIIQREEEINRLNFEIEKLKNKYSKIWGAKGGMTKEINKLRQELAEANEKLSQRYIIKELKPEKAKNMQVMKTKDSSVTSKIIKKVTDE